jgi:hypothetical protein
VEAPGTPRQVRHELAHRLMAEYADTVPAGQVLAAVLRTDRLLSSYHSVSSDRSTLCEELVRRRFAAAVGWARGAEGPVGG